MARAGHMPEEHPITMTYAETQTSHAALENALRIAQHRSARGNATRRDWERVAAIDPDLAYRELRDLLRRAGNANFEPTNPFERQSRIPGAFIGFLLGVLAMAIAWVILFELQDRWVTNPLLRDIATGSQFLATVLVPLGLVLGARWSRRRSTTTETRASLTVPKGATFDNLLERFERTQNIGRARVY